MEGVRVVSDSGDSAAYLLSWSALRYPMWTPRVHHGRTKSHLNLVSSMCLNT